MLMDSDCPRFRVRSVYAEVRREQLDKSNFVCFAKAVITLPLRIVPFSPINVFFSVFHFQREEDHLMFAWPRSEKGGRELKASRLDLLDTELAKSLSKTQTFEYLSKYDSMPAFLAALTLTLFENTTFAG